MPCILGNWVNSYTPEMAPPCENDTSNSIICLDGLRSSYPNNGHKSVCLSVVCGRRTHTSFMRMENQFLQKPAGIRPRSQNVVTLWKNERSLPFSTKLVTIRKIDSIYSSQILRSRFDPFLNFRNVVNLLDEGFDLREAGSKTRIVVLHNGYVFRDD